MVFMTRPTAPRKAERLSVGDSVFLIESGLPVRYLVVQKGNPGSDYYKNVDGVWLMRDDLFDAKISPADAAQALAFELPGYLPEYDGAVLRAAKTVTVPYYSSGSSVKTVETMFFAQSAAELFGTRNAGAQLEFWAAGASKIAYLDGIADAWATRDYYKASSDYYYYATAKGASGTSSGDRYIRPTMIVDYDARFDLHGILV